MIDCRNLTLTDDLAASLAAKAKRHSPPIALLVTEADAARLGRYVADTVPVTSDPAGVPPPILPDPPVVVPPSLDTLRAQRAAEMQAEVRGYVRAHFTPDDEATVNNIAALLHDKRAAGDTLTDTEAGTLVTISWARQWVMAATAAAGRAMAACAVAETAEALAAITVDLEALGAPPEVGGGKLALMLLGGE